MRVQGTVSLIKIRAIRKDIVDLLKNGESRCGNDK